MAADEKIVIEIEFDDGTVRKGFIGVQKQAEVTSKKVNKGLKKQQSSAKALGKDVLKLATAYLGFRTVVGIFRKLGDAIGKAAEQQEAVVALNSSLALAGGFSEAASQSFQDLASRIQSVTKFGDELILSQAALARNFVKTNEEAEALIEAAVDLSAATGLTLDSAVKNLGKTFAGLTGELGESVPILRTLTAEQLKAGAAVELISERFGGAAALATNTYTGALEQNANALGDTQEELGKIVTESSFAINAIKDVTEIFQVFGKELADFRKEGGSDIFADMTKSVVDFVGSFTFIVTGFFEPFANAILVLFSLFSSGLNRMISGFADGAASLIEFFKPGSPLAGTLREFSKGFADDAKLDMETAAEAVKGLFSFEAATAVATSFGVVTEKIDELSAKATGLGQVVNQVMFTVEQATVGAGQGMDLAFAGFAEGFQTTSENIGAAKTKLVNDFKAIGNAARDGLARGAGSAFAAFGKALANGENALEAFAKAFIGAIGQQAIAVGTEMILRGVGYSIDPLLSGFGPPLIAAGAALATFGGVLSAVAGGGGGPAPGGSGGGGGGGSLGSTETSLEAPDIEEKPKNEIGLVIQGDVLDSDQTGLRIVDIIKDFTDKNGTTEVFQT
jgi:hypothetical protein